MTVAHLLPSDGNSLRGSRPPAAQASLSATERLPAGAGQSADLPAPASRLEAIKLGFDTYFTGKPCRKGHLSARYAANSHCMQCNSERSSSRYAEDPEKAKEAIRKWRADNPDKQRKLRKREYSRNRDSLLAANKRYRAENPEIIKEHKLTQYAKRKGAIERTRISDIKAIHDRQGGLCVYCNEILGLGYHVDHKTPLSRGGSNAPDNLQILCARCNTSKGNLTHDEYLERRVA